MKYNIENILLKSYTENEIDSFVDLFMNEELCKYMAGGAFDQEKDDIHSRMEGLEELNAQADEDIQKIHDLHKNWDESKNGITMRHHAYRVRFLGANENAPVRGLARKKGHHNCTQRFNLLDS